MKAKCSVQHLWIISTPGINNQIDMFIAIGKLQEKKSIVDHPSDKSKRTLQRPAKNNAWLAYSGASSLAPMKSSTFCSGTPQLLAVISQQRNTSTGAFSKRQRLGIGIR